MAIDNAPAGNRRVLDVTPDGKQGKDQPRGSVEQPVSNSGTRSRIRGC